MAIELCPAETAPRISFSHDFCTSMQQCGPPLRSTSWTLNSSIDFEFDVPVIHNIDQECYYSSADELFSDGKILPLQIRKKISPHKQEQEEPTSAGYATPKDIKAASKEANHQDQSSKLFWQFKRSSSLTLVSRYKRRLSPSTLLSKSSSTGSAPNVKPGPVLKEGHDIGNHGQNYQKGKTYPACQQSSRKNQRPTLKKSFAHGFHGNGVTINPVLNVPSVDIFCLNSVFLTSKDKNK